MAKDTEPVPEIVRAARELEDEIAHLEALSRSVRKIPLNGQKNIARAVAALGEATALPERMAQRLRAVTAAIAQLQERQQEALDPLANVAAQIQQRTQRFEEHLQIFGALGQMAGEVNELLKVAAPTDAAALARAQQQLHELSVRARALFEAARADDFPELAREADLLKQRAESMSKRLVRPS